MLVYKRMTNYGTAYYRYLANLGPQTGGATTAQEAIGAVSTAQRALGELGSQSAGVVRPPSEVPETVGQSVIEEGAMGVDGLSSYLHPGVTAERYPGAASQEPKSALSPGSNYFAAPEVPNIIGINNNSTGSTP